MRIDLHCHSKHSKRATLWIMQKLGCPESFTEPLDLYAIARERGMDAVTITDHNVIDGCLDIAHLPNTFISCEYTTYFPDDGCKVHVLAYGISERQHEDITETRENIFDLVAYLRDREIHHVCAHPLFSPNDRLTTTHIEKLLLLFKNWEWNGDHHPVMNTAVERIAGSLTPASTYKLADKHGIKIELPELWKKNFTAGSDDHSSLHLANTYTEVLGARSIEEFWHGVHSGRAIVHATPGSPESFARNIYGIGYQFYRSKFGLDRHAGIDPLLDFLDRILRAAPGGGPARARPILRVLANSRKRRGAGSESLLTIVRTEAEKLLERTPALMELVGRANLDNVDLEETWFDFSEQIANQVLVHLGGRTLEAVSEARLLSLFDLLASAGSLYTVLGAHMVSYAHYAQERQFSLDMLRALTAPPAGEDLELPEPRILHFTDTFFEVNGVARTLQQQLAAARRMGKDYRVAVCRGENFTPVSGLVSFEAAGAFSLPEYAELKMLAPPLLRVLRYCYEEQVTHLHVSTPGPVGLAALAVARILRLPISGTYHTALPQYGKILTGDSQIEDLLWKGMVWFYDQLDVVYVPSMATGAELTSRGVRPERIRVYPRGIDNALFHPSRRADRAARWGLDPSATAILYAGRVSREKNLESLVEAFKRLLASGERVELVVAGDGPYRKDMEAALAGRPARFLGYLDREELASLYASCDLLAFPSTTDTFGNVVLEAQASGIPVVVSDEGGPCENVLPDITGLVIPARDTGALHAALTLLAREPARRRQMGLAARVYMEQRGFDAAFARLYSMYVEDVLEPARGGPGGDAIPLELRQVLAI